MICTWPADGALVNTTPWLPAALDTVAALFWPVSYVVLRVDEQFRRKD